MGGGGLKFYDNLCVKRSLADLSKHTKAEVLYMFVGVPKSMWKMQLVVVLLCSINFQ